MTIEIREPELVTLFQKRLLEGGYRSVDEMLLDVLQPLDTPAWSQADRLPGKNLVEIGAMVRGLAEDCDFSRTPSPDRPVDLGE